MSRRKYWRVIALIATMSGVLGVCPTWAASYSRTEVTTYHDDLDDWVLGQTAKVACVRSTPGSTACDGDVVSQTTFTIKAQPQTRESFGKLRQSLGYNADGTLAWARDGAGNQTTLSNWYRGIPRSIKYADNSTQSATVNADGSIASVTDENGFVTKYQYDAMGRLKLTDYPDGDTVAWTSAARTFSFVSGVYGLPNHWRMWERTGNGYKLTHYDAMWRPVVTETYDSANPVNTRSIVVSRYDAAGRLAFQSYPVRTLGVWTDTALQGATTTYDALGRARSVTQDSELGDLTTTTSYLNNANGPYTLVTDPRGNQTRTWFQTFDQPSYDIPVTIWHPAGAYTHITRDPFGKPTRLRRSNSSSPTGGTVALNRDYYYNGYQELCRTREPETGDTFMGYDAAGNLAWSAGGYNSTAGGCLGASSVAARRVDRAYDARNRPIELRFPDGQGDTVTRYTPDGLPASISAYNGSDVVTSSYAYNRRRLPTVERMQWGSIDWSITHAYNTNGHLSADGYPGGLSVGYAPNALGQPAQAGSFATGVSYHPNGAISQFTYGNGIVHTLAQNARGLPDRSVDAYGATKFLDDGYDYDGNGNVAGISDGATGRNQRGNRTMTYDGLDRLTGVVSPMYGSTNATYAYDVLDNLTRVHIGGAKQRDHYHCYDQFWRLTNVKTGGCGGTTVMGLGYDEQGNLSQKNGATFTFDYGNRLRTSTAGGSISYVYDGHGRRVRDFVTGAGSKYSLYSQSGSLMFDSDLRKKQQHQYIYLGGSLVATREKDTVTGTYSNRYQHTDALGSPVVVTAQNRGVLERTEYEPYGQVLNRSLKDGPGYTGHVEDARTGLSYMQQRYYDPQIGRFLSVDPVTADSATGANFNRYWYANNNPYKFTDPDGRVAQVIWGGIIGAGVEIAAQKLANPNASINWNSVGVATAVGAATGGVASVARAAAMRGTITVAQSVNRTAAANAAISAAGSAADSSVNGQSPDALKMATAALVGGGLSLGAGRVANADAITAQRMSSAPVSSPQGIGAHIVATTQSAGAAARSNAAASAVGEQAANVVGATAQKKVEERIDRKR
ncbi:RHS repeat-associated core domain-containing protein [Novilysobacter arseniciresistens]|uniref:RHS repeat-associated core domain-containing protein n=1 Tax=Novilysobacter arseniciresistens TaxID=1385522 RepID=UPI0006898355|nr:RHS repeat-associated core domain-containing protein [Lysobacter arseniciresistens]